MITLFIDYLPTSQLKMRRSDDSGQLANGRHRPEKNGLSLKLLGKRILIRVNAAHGHHARRAPAVSGA
jgi:hypothetical protein